MKYENINVLMASMDSLEQTAEGQLRGGFAVIGGGEITPLDNGNEDCKNDKCNVGCGHHNTGYCRNHACNGGCPVTTTNAVSQQGFSSLGATFSL